MVSAPNQYENTHLLRTSSQYKEVGNFYEHARKVQTIVGKTQ